MMPFSAFLSIFAAELNKRENSNGTDESLYQTVP